MLTLAHWALHRATLNVCIPYASKDEMAYSINRCVQENGKVNNCGQRIRNGNGISTKDGLGVKGDSIEDIDSLSRRERCISVQDIESNLMLAHSPPLDILVRTSGVCRLSDFMLWQVRRCQVI